MTRAAALLLAPLLFAHLLIAPGVARAQDRPPSPVQAEAVVRGEVAPRASFVGTVRATQSAVLGSEEAVDSDVIDENLAKPDAKGLSTNLGDLFKKALGDKKDT